MIFTSIFPRRTIKSQSDWRIECSKNSTSRLTTRWRHESRRGTASRAHSTRIGSATTCGSCCSSRSNFARRPVNKTRSVLTMSNLSHVTERVRFILFIFWVLIKSNVLKPIIKRRLKCQCGLESSSTCQFPTPGDCFNLLNNPKSDISNIKYQISNI